jgi:Uma2 family endonuclease
MVWYSEITDAVFAIHRRSLEMAVVEAPHVRLWTRDEYYQMASLGLFRGQRVELILGQIIEMSPQSSRHATVVLLVQEAVRQAFGPGYVVRSQLPLSVDASSDPEPDIAVVAGDIRDNVDEHPASALLIVEVADSSLHYDRVTKASIYAKAQIAEYWIVNVVEGIVEVYRSPQPDDAAAAGYTYTKDLTFRRGDVLTPLARPQARIAISDLLP